MKDFAKDIMKIVSLVAFLVAFGAIGGLETERMALGTGLWVCGVSMAVCVAANIIGWWGELR